MKNMMVIREKESRDLPISGGKPAIEPQTGVKSERGVVLVVVLILSAVVLAAMTALVYMLTAGTQISGLQKRYKTSLDAAKGGGEIFYQVIGLRGVAADDNVFLNTLTTGGLTASLPITANAACTGVSGGTTYNAWQAKLMASTTSWTNCNSSVTIDPNDSTTYDMSMQMGTTPKYNVYAKIVQTVEGNSGGDTSLFNKGVVSSGTGEIQVMPKPFLYDIEILSSNSTNPSERAKYSILYQY